MIEARRAAKHTPAGIREGLGFPGRCPAFMEPGKEGRCREALAVRQVGRCARCKRRWTLASSSSTTTVLPCSAEAEAEANESLSRRSDCKTAGCYRKMDKPGAAFSSPPL